MSVMRKYVTAATGAIATTLALDPERFYQLVEVRIHLSAAGGAGDFTITVDANEGAAYDSVLATQDMTSVVSYVYQPDKPLIFDKGDELDFAWANSSNRTYGLTVIYELISG